MKQRADWHAVMIDGRSFDVKYIGQGWGRAVAIIRGTFPEIGRAVLKATSSASDQNRLEMEVLREVEAAEEAAVRTMDTRVRVLQEAAEDGVSAGEALERADRVALDRD